MHRWQEIREENETAGFTILGHYWTYGQYDLVTVVEAPSEEAMLPGLFSGAHLLLELLVRVPRTLTSVQCPECGEDVLDTQGQQIDSLVAISRGRFKE